MNRVIRSKVLTPMFLFGADQTTPELRVPSIKGAMRFWWRAAQRYQTIEELKEKEARTFGGLGDGAGKSPSRIRIISCALATGLYQLFPHHRDNWCGEDKGCPMPGGFCKKQRATLGCFEVGGTFSVQIMSRSQDIFDKAQKAFELSAILGGLGRRSRRGFGCYFIEDPIEGPECPTFQTKICGLLNTLLDPGDTYNVDDLTWQGSVFRDVIQGPPTRRDYPQIKFIFVKQTNRSYGDVLIKIGEASHNARLRPGNDCGSIQPSRLASPVYISMSKFQNILHVVITLLSSNKNQDNQIAFIQEVLSHV